MASADPNTPDQSTTANPDPSVPLLTSLPEPERQPLSVIYTQLTTYPFHADLEFLSGLAAILGHPSVPATPDELRSNPELVLQARCFYISRRFNIDPPIEPAKYLEWSKDRAAAAKEGDITQGSVLGEAEEEGAQSFPSSLSATATAAPPSTPQTSAPVNNEPTYPPSFAAIIDLITKNLPIPGIEEIPSTILEPGTSKVDHTPRRKKPWEREGPSSSTGGIEGVQTTEAMAASAGESSTGEQGTKYETENTGVNGNGNADPNEGVVKILQPNAIPPSGLLSSD